MGLSGFCSQGSLSAGPLLEDGLAYALLLMVAPGRQIEDQSKESANKTESKNGSIENN